MYKRQILPLLCRRGHITRNEIGAIRISGNETYFQVQRAAEAKFKAALQRTARAGAEDETGIHIERSPDQQPQQQRAGPSAGRTANAGRPQPHAAKPWKSDGPKPHRKGPRTK